MAPPIESKPSGITERALRLAGLVLLVPVLCFGSPILALLAAAAFSMVFSCPPLPRADMLGKLSLQAAVVLLGLSLNVDEFLRQSTSFSIAVAGIVFATLGAGLLIGKLTGTDSDTSTLVSVGTAICGGTAVASLSPVIRAPAEKTGVVLAMVFLLNAMAMLAFPLLGEMLSLSQREFGIWAAFAIHDTAAVLGAAAIYGQESAELAATLKLARMLWLIPVLLLFSIIYHASDVKLRIPLFIVLFVVATLIGSSVTIPTAILDITGGVSRSLLVIALFCIGSEMSITTLRQVRGRLVVQGMSLWVIVVIASLGLAVWLG